MQFMKYSTDKNLCKLNKIFKSGSNPSTLPYLIIVQDVINMQAGKFPGINKRAGCNKAMQVGIFQESIVKKTCRLEKFQKLINVQDVIRLCRLDFFKKIIKRAACLLDRLEYISMYSHFSTFKQSNSYF